MQNFKLGWEPKLCLIFSKYNKITLSLVTKMTLNARVTGSKRQRESSASINYKDPRGLANCDFASRHTIFSSTNSSSLKRPLSSHCTSTFSDNII